MNHIADNRINQVFGNPNHFSTILVQENYPTGSHRMSSVIYQDRLICITNDSITFFNYSFPVLGRKVVSFFDIDHISVRKPAITTGKWRIWGSSDLSTWFSFDSGRPWRDRIFICTLYNQRMKIGFTVENSSRVIGILREQGVRLVD